MRLQAVYPAGKYLGARPYDSSWGMPLWSYILAVVFLLYIIIRVWVAIKRDKK